MNKQKKHQNSAAPTSWGFLQKPAVRWAFVLALAAALGVIVSYYWRVFFYLDGRMSPLVPTLGCVAFAWAVVGAATLLGYVIENLPKRGFACILLCGMLFAFANPPLQTPDETDHFLRTYTISQGHLDFDALRGYPADVTALVRSFPGAWVNAHTSAGMGTDPDTGEDTPYNTAGYALKQYGKEGEIESITASFEQYFNLTTAPDTEKAVRAAGLEPATEPISFLVLPFAPGALGMALARLFGFGALGCLYGGRLLNLLAYAALCWLALSKAERLRPALLCVMLLPMSLFMGASLSYDATLLGCYYLMLALLTRKEWDGKTIGLYAAACVFANVAKPYINLLWALLPLALVAGQEWKAKGRRLWWTSGMLAGAFGATFLVEWYGNFFRHNYPVIARQGGSTVNGGQQLQFILQHPQRYLSVLLGTLYENEFFAGQLGLFGWKDLPIPLLNLTGLCMLLVGAVLAAGCCQSLGRRRNVGLGLFAAVYGAGAMTAMYITYTPVAMVRIVGLQTRYFMMLWLILVLLGSVPLAKLLQPKADPERMEGISIGIFGCYAAFGAVLLFQHYFIGPFYTIPMA